MKILILILMLSACTTIKPLALNSEAIDSGEAMATVYAANLSDVEKLQITHAVNKFKSFVYRWNGFDAINGGDRIGALITEFDEIRREYQTVKSITLKHWDEYSADDKLKLKEFQAQAKIYQALYDDMVSNRQWWDAVTKARDFAVVAIGLAQTVRP